MDSNDMTTPSEQPKTVILLEKYTDSIVARSLVQAIPYIGSVLDIALTNSATKIKEDRVFQYLSCLAEKIKNNEDQFKQLSQSFPGEMLDAFFIQLRPQLKRVVIEKNNILQTFYLSKHRIKNLGKM